ncbi:exported hypothetical protein [Nostocoides australiense Ben110]|uniref:Uncharacterized protein n=1 Tax=Nostocoides australiense Ben110 TaxID=1193182 RepID=W6K4T6_9MICO|nr:exported hypothetical protein [Tetrasphaera australiensis Ben110]
MAISLAAVLTALATSCLSNLLTMSMLASATAYLSSDLIRDRAIWLAILSRAPRQVVRAANGSGL